MNSMVEILSNGKNLILKLSHTLSVASSYAEFFSGEKNVEIKKIESKRDMNVIETVYQVEPKNNNAEITVIIKDDNQYNWSYHHDFIYFRFDGEKWTSEYKPNPNYH